MPDALRTPPAPASLQHILQAWYELAASRQHGFGAPQPIGWSDIDAWARLTATRLAPWEARLVRRIDECWMSAWNAEQKRRAAKRPAGD